MLTEYYTFRENRQLIEAGQVNKETVIKTVSAFKANREIWDELNHYQKHGQILGKHPKFERFNRARALDAMNSLELTRQRKNTIKSRNELRKLVDANNRPELHESRVSKLHFREWELQHIDKILADR